ncbi:MAG: DUF3048 domain-containing protein [Candidatus Kerfeldbacteria bacterium]|nr:DUF3048 domain-containing protein [Candidatus Kerfeldbacteria bacterium]
MAKNKTKKTAVRTVTWELRLVGALLAVTGLALGAVLSLDLVRGWRLMFPAVEASGAVVGAPLSTSDARPVQYARRLDGVFMDSSAAADSAPVGIMIENSVETRPQSGLAKARVVYETLAEGGVTRFLAIFALTDEVKKIGPVRSARHYYVDLIEEYGGAYAHAGGSPLGLSQISRDQVPDLNGIGNAWRYFYRDNNLPAPHNLFTNSVQLNRAVVDLRYPSSAEFDPWTYDDVRTPPTGSTPATSIAIDFSGRAYLANYEYEASSNTYLRSNGGRPHTDRDTGHQLRTDNVVVQVVPRPKLLAEKGRIDLEVIGRGQVLVFRNGTVVEGTWTKETPTGRTAFSGPDGQAISLNRGTTWVAIVPADRPVTYR